MRYIILCSLFFGGCASVTPELYLDAGQTVRVTSPTQLELRCEPDGSFLIKSQDYILGKNLVVH